MTFEPKRVSPPTSEEVRPTLNNARNAMRCLMRNCSCEMGMDVVNAVQLTLALTAGIGCGVIIGAMLSRRRVRPFSSAVSNNASPLSSVVSTVTLRLSLIE